jgi:hypothetical protein
MRKGRGMWPRVKAVYRHSLLLFEIPLETSKTELTALLDSFGKDHGELLTIEVTPLPPRDAIPPDQPCHLLCRR